jgi:hypothetical protein
MKLWIWNWQSGGYNSCQASTRDEAIEKANHMTRYSILVLDVMSLHEGTYDELGKLDAKYACLYF